MHRVNIAGGSATHPLRSRRHSTKSTGGLRSIVVLALVVCSMLLLLWRMHVITANDESHTGTVVAHDQLAVEDHNDDSSHDAHRPLQPHLEPKVSSKRSPKGPTEVHVVHVFPSAKPEGAKNAASHNKPSSTRRPKTTTTKKPTKEPVAEILETQPNGKPVDRVGDAVGEEEFHHGEHHDEAGVAPENRLVPEKVKKRELLLRLGEVPMEVVRDHLITTYSKRTDANGENHVVSLLCSIALPDSPAAVTQMEERCVQELGNHDSPHFKMIRMKKGAKVVNVVAKTGNDGENDGEDGSKKKKKEMTFVESVTHGGALDEATGKKVVKHCRKMQTLAQSTIVNKFNPYPNVSAKLAQLYPDEFDAEEGLKKRQKPVATHPHCPLNGETDLPYTLEKMLKKKLPVTVGVHVVAATKLQATLSGLLQKLSDKASGNGNEDSILGWGMTLLQNLLANAERTIIVVDGRYTKRTAVDYAFFNILSHAIFGKGGAKTPFGGPANPLQGVLTEGGCSVTPLVSDIELPHSRHTGGKKQSRAARKKQISEHKVAGLDGDVSADEGEEFNPDVDLLMGGVLALDITCGAKETIASTMFGQCEDLFEKALLDKASEALDTVYKREQMSVAKGTAKKRTDFDHLGALPLVCSHMKLGTLLLHDAIKFGTKTAIYSGDYLAENAKPDDDGHYIKDSVAVKHFNVAQYATFRGFHHLMKHPSRHPLINYPTSSCIEPSAHDSVFQLQPFLKGTNLLKYMKHHKGKKHAFSWKQRIEVAMQIACIFQYLHSHPLGWFTFDDNHPEQYFLHQDHDTGVLRVHLVDIDTLQLGKLKAGAKEETEGDAVIRKGSDIQTKCRCFYCKGRSNCLFINTPEGYAGCHQSGADPSSGDKEPANRNQDPEDRQCNGNSDAFFVGQLLYFLVDGQAPWAGQGLQEVVEKLGAEQYPVAKSDSPEYNKIVKKLFAERTPDYKLISQLMDLCKLYSCGVDTCPNPEDTKVPYSGFFTV